MKNRLRETRGGSEIEQRSPHDARRNGIGAGDAPSCECGRRAACRSGSHDRPFAGNRARPGMKTLSSAQYEPGAILFALAGLAASSVDGRTRMRGWGG